MWLVKFHAGCALVSISTFVVRGYWRRSGSPLLHSKLTGVLPHVVDTALLLSGIGLAVQWAVNPLENSWLMAKLIALVVYIVLGMIALKRGRTLRQRTMAWIVAILVFAYMVAVAFTKSPVLGLN